MKINTNWSHYSHSDDDDGGGDDDDDDDDYDDDDDDDWLLHNNMKTWNPSQLLKKVFVDRPKSYDNATWRIDEQRPTLGEEISCVFQGR